MTNECENATTLSMELITLGTVPAGSRFERDENDPRAVWAFLPDGSAKRFSLKATSMGLVSVVDHVPPIKWTIGKL